MRFGSRRYRLIVCLVVTLGCGVIAGCDFRNNSVGDVSVRAHDGLFELAVCDDLDAKDIQVSTAEKVLGGAADVSWWHASGNVRLEGGSILTTRSLPTFFPDVQLDVEPQLRGVEVLTVVIHAEQSADNVVASFDLRRVDVDGVGWVHPRGAVTTEACDSAGVMRP